uniref:Curli production assembly/transport component CsgE n=1 Tax=Thermodesulfobacterium geofontis TaxID=1295609 RepID=A0A7C4JR73_9BACT
MKKRLILIAIFLLFFSTNALAQKEEITGLIFDYTKSKIGRTFYDEFVKNWSPPPGMDIFNITIEEWVDPKFGSVMIVRIDSLILYQNFVLPREEDIELKVKEALEVVTEFLLNWKKYEKQLEMESKIL